MGGHRLWRNPTDKRENARGVVRSGEERAAPSFYLAHDRSLRAGLQGRARRPRRAHESRWGVPITQSDYRQASICVGDVGGPVLLRDFGKASDAHDSLTDRQDSGFADLGLPPSPTFREHGPSFAVIELDAGNYPPRIREVGFTEADFAGVDKVTAPGVQNGNTRLLLPLAETTPVAWQSWRDTADVVIEKWRNGWNSPSRGDATRVHFGSAPFQACSRNVRTPLNESPRCSGSAENWRGRWKPYARAANPPNSRDASTWRVTYSPTSLDPPYTGRGLLSHPASESLGCPPYRTAITWGEQWAHA